MPFQCEMTFSFAPGKDYEYLPRDSKYLAREGLRFHARVFEELTDAQRAEVMGERKMPSVELADGGDGVTLAGIREEIQRRLDLLREHGGRSWTVVSREPGEDGELGPFRSLEQDPIRYVYYIPDGKCCHSLQLFEYEVDPEVASGEVWIEDPETDAVGFACATLEFWELQGE